MGHPPDAMTLHEQIKHRQISLCGKGQRASSNTTRFAYSELVPNYTIYKVQVPLHHIILRFTPDGKYLVCMSSISNVIYLYYLKTCIYPWSIDCPNFSLPDEQSCFPHYFGLKYKQLIKLSIGHHLCKSFCLALSNGKYMILASSTAISNQSNRRTLEAIDELVDYTFYTIEMETGKNISQYSISSDFLRLDQNACVSVYDQMFAILSLKTQAIKLILVDVHGLLHELRSIGKFLHSDDQLIIDLHKQRDSTNCKRQKQTTSYLRPKPPQQHDYDGYPRFETFVPASLLDSLATNNMDNVTINKDGNNYSNNDNSYWDDIDHGTNDQGTPFYGSFQQAFLSKLFRTYKEMNDGGNAMQQFYQNFDVYANLKFWEIQFLDGQNLLVKMLPGNTLLNTNGVGAMNTLVIFVIFNIQTSQIEDVFDHANEKVVQLINDYADTILGTPPDGTIWLGSNFTHQSQSNFKSILPDQLRPWSESNQGSSRANAIRRLAMELPIISQSYMDCPYFDRSLFNCDERLVSSITSKPRSTNEVIKFYSSITNQLKFKINPNPSCNERQLSSHLLRQQSIIIPHPKYPFIITKQLTIYNSPTINFHLYKPPLFP